MTSRRSFLGAAIASLPLLAPVTRAGTEAGAGTATVLPTDPVLAKLIRESTAARPELRQAEAAARAERERVPQAGALPDPTLSLGIQNDGFGSIEIGRMETSFYQVMLTQPLPWPGKRGLRADLAELGAKQADASTERLRLSTEADVRRAYLGLVLTRDRLALLGALESLWQKSAGVARARYETGQAAQSDVLRAQLELNRLRQRRFALEAEEKATIEALNRLRAHPLDEQIETSATVRGLEPPALPGLEAAIADAEGRSPELAAARLGSDQESKLAALSRRERFPDLTVSAGIMPRGALEPMWTASVGMSLPIWAARKQIRAVSESDARAESSALGVEAIRQVLRLRVEERRTALGALLDTLRLYREGLLVQSRATSDSTISQYQVGKVSFASVLEANVGYVNDEDGYLQAAADAQRIAIASAEVSLEPVGALAAGAMSGSSIPGSGGAPAAVGRGAGRTGGATPGEASQSMTGM